MNKLILIFIILSAISAFSQFEIIAEGQLTNEYRASLSYFPTILSDNSILLTFNGAHPTYNKAKFIKIDFDGKFIWEAQNNYKWMFDFWDVIEKDNKEIRILGYRNRDSTAGDSWFGSYYDLTIDKNGKNIREVSTVHDIDKNLLAAPWANLSFNQNRIVENTKSLENNIMYYITRTLDDNYQGVDTLFKYKDKYDCINYYFAKNQYNQFLNLLTLKDFFSKYEFKIIFLDADLKIKDSMNYTGAWLGNSFIYANEKFFGVTKTEDNYKKSPNLLIKKDFKTNKETIIEFRDSTKYQMAGMLPDGNILLYGKKYNIIDNCEISLLTVIDENAQIISEQYLSDCGPNFLAYATIFDNDKVVLTGQNNAIPFWKILKYKSTSVETKIDNKASIYPNPASDNLTVSFVSPKEADGTIDIIDILGKTVCSTNSKLIEGHNNIQIQELSSLPIGSYTTIVKINNEIVSVGKFIKK